MQTYEFKMVNESLKVLKRAHRNHCSDCCPDPSDIDFGSRVPELEVITGTHPVFGDPMAKISQVVEMICSSLGDQSYDMFYDVRKIVRHVLRQATIENWDENVINPEKWEMLKTALKDQDEYLTKFPELLTNGTYKKFELIKKSSPKLSNLVNSCVKWLGEDIDKSEIIKTYNARQSSQLKDMELVISIEPHRIVGMSAFGKNWTSCQDWISKEQGHEYHGYTHASWANMIDTTCGIAFIRNINDESPDINDPDVQDMLVRSLVRVLPLPNGQVVVYLHRIYGASPYDQVIKSTFDKWEKTLPENYHVVKMYDYNKDEYREFKNKYGKEYSGFTSYTFKQEECTVTAGSRCECEDCNGSGTYEWSCEYCGGSGEYESENEVDCECCEGSGYIDDERCEECRGRGYNYEYEMCECPDCEGIGTEDRNCENCGGEGYFEDDQTENDPYNDHSEYIHFNYKGIRYQVPNYILNWDVQPEHTVALPPNWGVVETISENIKVGDTVKLRVGLVIGEVYGITLFHGMMFEGERTVERTQTESGTVYYDLGNYWYSAEMIESATPPVVTQLPANQKLKVGDKVRILPNLVARQGYKMFSDLYSTDSVVGGMAIRAGQIATITSVGFKYKIDLDEGAYNWTDEMFQLEKIENVEVA